MEHRKRRNPFPTPYRWRNFRPLAYAILLSEAQNWHCALCGITMEIEYGCRQPTRYDALKTRGWWGHVAVCRVCFAAANRPSAI